MNNYLAKVEPLSLVRHQGFVTVPTPAICT